MMFTILYCFSLGKPEFGRKIKMSKWKNVENKMSKNIKTENKNGDG